MCSQQAFACSAVTCKLLKCLPESGLSILFDIDFDWQTADKATKLRHMPSCHVVPAGHGIVLHPAAMHLALHDL